MRTPTCRACPGKEQEIERLQEQVAVLERRLGVLTPPMSLEDEASSRPAENSVDGQSLPEPEWM